MEDLRKGTYEDLNVKPRQRQTFVALIQKRTEFGNRHWMKSSNGETEQEFVNRVHKCYGTPSNYWEVEIYHLDERIEL